MGVSHSKAEHKAARRTLPTCRVCHTQIIKGCSNNSCRRDCRGYGRQPCRRHKHNGRPRLGSTPQEQRSALFEDRPAGANPTRYPYEQNRLQSVRHTRRGGGSRGSAASGSSRSSVEHRASGGSSSYRQSYPEPVTSEYGTVDSTIDSTVSTGSGNALHENEYMRAQLASFTRFREDIWMAARSNDADGVKYFLEQGADINSEDLLGNTPLFYASQSGHTEMIIMLLNLGARDPVETKRCWWNARNIESRKVLESHYEEQMQYNNLAAKAISKEPVASTNPFDSVPDSIPAGPSGDPSVDELLASVASRFPPVQPSAPPAEVDVQDPSGSATYSAPIIATTTTTTTTSTGPAVVDHGKQRVVEGEGSGDSASASDDIDSDQDDVSRRTVHEYEKALQDLTEQNLCKICYETAVNVTFVPCGHLGFCDDCVQTLTECPVCRKIIEHRLRVYRV